MKDECFTDTQGKLHASVWFCRVVVWWCRIRVCEIKSETFAIYSEPVNALQEWISKGKQIIFIVREQQKNINNGLNKKNLKMIKKRCKQYFIAGSVTLNHTSTIVSEESFNFRSTFMLFTNCTLSRITLLGTPAWYNALQHNSCGMNSTFSQRW